MNVIRELINFFRQQAGIIFASQPADPLLPVGVVAFWHNSTSDAFRLQDARGRVGDIAILAPVADTDTTAAIATEHRVIIPAGPTGNVDVVVSAREEIVDVVLHKTGASGGGAGTIQLVNAATGAPLTDAMSINAPSGTVVRPLDIDPTQNTIAAQSLLRFVRTRTASTDESCIAYVRTLRRP
jgi:hypothetical protein